MTSSNGKLFRVTGPLCGEFTEIPLTKGQWRETLAFCLICAWNKGLSKQSRCRWHIYLPLYSDMQQACFTNPTMHNSHIPQCTILKHKCTHVCNFKLIHCWIHVYALWDFKISITLSALSDATLTHWGRDKMAAIFQTTFLNAFSWMKMFKFRLRFHWSLFPRVQLRIFQHWFR